MLSDTHFWEMMVTRADLQSTRQVRNSACDKESQTLTISILLGRWTGKHSSNFLLFSILLFTQCLVTLAGTPCLSIFFFFCRSSFMREKRKKRNFLGLQFAFFSSSLLPCYLPLKLKMKTSSLQRQAGAYYCITKKPPSCIF